MALIDKPKESDWKVFRDIVPELRERYLRGRNAELAALLGDDSLSPTEQFWNVEKRARDIARILRECLDGHSRSKMVSFMKLMHKHDMLTAADLERFSLDLREMIRHRL